MTSTSTTDRPVYKYNSATIPYSEQLMGDLKKSITDQIFTESPIISLLRKKTEEAEKEMKTQLNRSIWTGTPHQENTYKSLKEIISEAYDEHMPKEAVMYDDTNIAEAAVRKRKEARAEVLADEVGGYLEGNDWDSGDQFTWTVTFHDSPDKTYHYVALRGGNHWFLTGRSGRFTHDQILGIIVDLGLRGSIDTHDW